MKPFFTGIALDVQLIRVQWVITNTRSWPGCKGRFYLELDKGTNT